mgnify:FL=1
MSSDETTTGDMRNSNGVAVGSEASASAANANVTINQGAEPGVRDMIRMLWVQSLNDAIDRRERQKETDEHRTLILTSMERIERSALDIVRNIWFLRMTAIGLGIVDFLLIAEFSKRMGWW